MREKVIGVVQTVLHRAGIHLSRYPLRTEYENVLHDFLVGLGVECIVDVGANVGHYGAMLRGIGFSGRLVSFEPASATFERLSQRAAPDPKWETWRMALGASEGEMPMRIFPGHENSTLAEVADFGHEWLPSAFRHERIEQVSLRRLDSLLEDGFVDTSIPTLLKLDTEGYDWQVIEGAGTRVSEFVGLQTELMVQPIWKNTPSIGESVTRLAAMGFEPVAFAVPNRARISAIVVDGLFRNTRVTPDPERAHRMWNPAGMGLSPQTWEEESGEAEDGLRDDVGASWRS
jgi:FkbM family methyltransferase